MKTCIVFGFTLVSLLVQAQDVIIFRNGTLQNAHVLEVATDNIVYKKSENLDGPNYVADKNQIAVIEYANGSRDVMPYSNNTTTVAAPANNPGYSSPEYSHPNPVAYVRPQVNIIAAPSRPAYYYGSYRNAGYCNPWTGPRVYRGGYYAHRGGRRW